MLTVDTITNRLANEVTVESNVAVGGKLLMDTIDASVANQLSIQDNVVVGLTTANKNLTAHGNATIEGRCTVGGYSVQRSIAAGSASSGGTAPCRAPGTIRSSRAGPVLI